MAASVLVLASASPRRAELLTAAGIPFETRPAHIDEAVRSGEDARTYASRLAIEKAVAVASSIPGRPVLAADTVVVIDGQILGKPVDADDAKRMLRLLSGRTHEVMTAVALIANDPGGDFRGGGWKSPPGSLSYTAVEVTAVEFVLLSKAEIDWYVGTGEPSDKAGAYAIQGLASRYVSRIEGSYSNVVGLPVGLVYAMCTQAGILLS
ncbi:MAG TPA: Maf family protein [Vicinamibacterales bacterium]|nr:Maf family protein [Vicinamibacterales bacterium]